MGIGDWGLGIEDWGLGPFPHPLFPITKPQTPNQVFFFNLKRTKKKLNYCLYNTQLSRIL